jgi:hypothetical protein
MHNVLRGCHLMTELSGIASIDSQLAARVGLIWRIRRISNQNTAKKSNILLVTRTAAFDKGSDEGGR